MSKKSPPFLWFFSLLTLAALVAGGVAPLSARAQAAAPWQDKVDPWVLETAAAGQTEFLVFLTEQADLSTAASLPAKLAKGEYVYAMLSATAARTQGPVLAQLRALGVEYRPYWVANMIWVRGGLATVQALAQRPDVAHLYANPTVHLAEVPPVDAPTLPLAPETVEWNINLVGAPALWGMGVTGQGAVIAGQDTGYEWTHPALRPHYRGWDGATADHNYNWHDAIHSGGGSCGPNSNQPCDDNNHGTHTMGTMVGDDGGANQIGMAPGAKWIGCRNMDQGDGTPTTYSECFQWFIAPTDLAGNNPDPSKAPHVINNSWGCPPSEGCTNPNVLLTVVDNTRAAGIAVVVSAGNSGSSCSSVSTPAAIYDASFTVGATNSGDNIAGFSSRGPVTVDGSQRMKPDISAPGVDIRSSVRGGGYQSGWQGTSMAGPHVAGLVALLISAEPFLAGDVDTLESLITQNALPRTTNQGCGGDGPNDVPNNVYGWGRIDSVAAYNAIANLASLTVAKTASTGEIEPGGLLTYTLSTTNTHPFAALTALVLTDTLPAGTSFVAASGMYTFTGNTVIWDRALLASGQVWTETLTVQVEAASGTVSNEAYAARSAEVAEVAGETVSTSIVPFSADLVKSVSAAYVEPGGLLTYTLSTTNTHPFAALTALVLTDTLPAGTVFVTATQPHNLTGSTVTWGAPALAPGAGWRVTLVVAAPPSTSTLTLTNQAYGLAADYLEPVHGAPVETELITRGVGLFPDRDVTAEPGSTVVVVHSLVNTGNLTDTFAITHTSNLGWAVVAPPGVVLGPGEMITFTVAITVPGEALAGEVEAITLTVTSQSDLAVWDTAVDTVTVVVAEVIYQVWLPGLMRNP